MAYSVKEQKTKDDLHAKLIGYVEEYIDSTYESRKQSEKARDYFDGYQWTDEEVRKLRNRKQPAITINRIKPKVQFLKGMETQNRADPKALPREPNDENSSEVSTDALRFVEEKNGSDYKFSEGFETYVIEGIEAHEVIIEVRKGRPEVKHNCLKWDRILYDPHSRKNNFSDSRYLGTVQWMDEDEAREQYPEAPEDFFCFSESDVVTDSDTFEDKPLFFIDKDRKRVRVFFVYFLKGNVWNYAVFSGGAFAIKPTISPYLDEYGEPEPQFVFQSAFSDRNGNRYGEVASYLDPQDEINKRRSKFLHSVSVRQTWSNKGSVTDTQKIKRQMSLPDGHLDFNVGEWGKDFGIVPTTDMTQGQVALLQEAKSEIDNQGASSILQGNIPAPMSGKAVQSIQQGGVVDLGSLFDGHNQCRLRVYRMMFNRVKQFWTEERWVRVLGDEKKIKWTGLNRKITLRDQIVEEFGEVPPQFEGDPRLDIVVGVENPVNELDVDILLDQQADTLTLQAEQFELLTKMYMAKPDAIDFKLLIKASQLRNKDELIKMIEGGDDAQQAALMQAQQQEQAEAKQLAMLAQMAKIKVDESTAEKNIAQAEKSRADARESVVDSAIKIDEASEPELVANGR